jgi:hypothetical protein
LLPKSVISDVGAENDIEMIYCAVECLHLHGKTDDLHEFFRQIGADMETWLSISHPDEKV